MSDLPARQRSDPELTAQVPAALLAGRDEAPHLSELLGIVFRHKWLIAACTVSTLGAAVIYTKRTVPIYEAAATVRIEEKQPNLSEFFRTLSSGSGVVTEMEVLRSQTLAREAASQLGFLVRLDKPSGVRRSDIIGDLSFSPSATPGTYVLSRQTDSTFSLRAMRLSHSIRRVQVGQQVTANGLTFSLRPASTKFHEIRFQVQSADDAVGWIKGGLTVTQANRDANIVRVAFRDSDRELTARVPNAIVASFVARRQDAQKTEARSTVAFLREQIDTLAVQLKASENRLRDFREAERVVNPEVEANSQVTRLISLQSERAALEAERAALAKLLKEVHDAKAQAKPGTPSPYRRLLAFPTLIRNQAADAVLRSLASVEDQRSNLLARRTHDDPDVQALDSRINELEEQIGSVATTYLEGLTNQIEGLDATLQGFGQQLSQVPRRELEFARLERQPKLLDQVYSLLQTRLKEAEIAQAVEDASVQVLDPATVPRGPIKPRPALNLMAGLMVGLLLGVAGAFTREYMDRSVHTRADVLVATGVPALGLIPRIPRRGESIALISVKRDIETPRSKPRLPETGSRKQYYTFLTASPASQTVKTFAGGLPAIQQRAQRVVITDVGTAIAEAYGSLQTNLLYAKEGRPVRTLVFTSAQPSEGKTTTAVNLALSLAHRGARALLIDADLRRGMIHSVFGTPRQPGLSEVLLGGCSLEDALRYISVDNGQMLHYLTTGTLPSNPTAMIESQQLRDLLGRAAEQYDTIIIDSPPATVITDAALLGLHADGVVIVARAGVTHAAALECVMEQLVRVRAPVLGVVLNDIDFKRDAAYDPAYQYHDYTTYSTPTSE